VANGIKYGRRRKLSNYERAEVLKGHVDTARTPLPFFSIVSTDCAGFSRIDLEATSVQKLDC
jgi:hypothetical protein